MFSADRKSALERLEAFLPRAARHYAATRNSDFGPDNRENVSVLSPWVRHRLLCEEEIIRKTLKCHSFKSAEKYLQEVFWRAYFKGWLEQRPEVWSWYKDDLNAEIARLTDDKNLCAQYENAVRGDTGIECFDCWAKELIETGYLHNHARMWFASIWIFTLKLPWVLGADFFYRHLLDGDPASNTCSWRWVAGLHTKGKHYVARSANIEKFTNGRFNPVGQLNEAPLPVSELRDANLVPSPTGTLQPNGEYVLLIHEDDCSPETLNLSHSPTAIIGVCRTAHRSPLDVSDAVKTFSQNAVRDGLQRANIHFDCDVSDLTETYCADAIIETCLAAGIKNIVMPYMPVGPLADTFKEHGTTFSDAGITLNKHLRAYDACCWPHATRGFFKLKEKIPRLINELGLS